MTKKIENIIKNNYNISIEKIKKDIIFYNNEKILVYITKEEDKKIKELFNLSNYLYYKGIKNNTFLYNKNNEIITKYDDKKIILMKINDRSEDIDLNDIIKINIENNFEREDIKLKWQEQVDAYEENNYNTEILYDDYFIGMAENAIYLMSFCKTKNEELCHNIKIQDYVKKSFYNPFNYINTNYMYDVSNYIKYNYLKNKLELNEIGKIINNIRETNDQIYLYASLLFPNYYFDFKKEINKNIIYKYEKMLEYCKKELNNIKINDIEWIK